MIEHRRLLALAVAALLAVPAAAVERGTPVTGGNVSLPTKTVNAPGSSLTQLPDVKVPTFNHVAVPNVGVQPLQQQVPVSSIGQAIAPQIETISKQNIAGEGVSASGENIQRILQDGKTSQNAPTAVFAASSGEGNGGSGLSAPNPAAPSNPSAPVPPSKPAPTIAKQVNGRAAYAWRRTVLSAISTFWGMNFSLPVAGPRVESTVLQQVAGKRVLFSDIDDTLGPYNKVGAVVSPEMAQAIVNLRKSGKLFVAITDRPDLPHPKSSQKGAFQSFEPIAPADREGIILATNGGSKIYESVGGEWKLIDEMPGLPEDVHAKIEKAAEVVKGELAANGTGMKEEKFEPLRYSLILTAGTPEPVVKKLAQRLEDEMRALGLDYVVEGRMAKDPTLPPYVAFSAVTKTMAVQRIAKLKRVDADEAAAIGDSMYKPFDKPRGRLAARMRKVGERMSGGEMPLTGNATDANMELGLPGMLAISVGGTADPNMINGYVLLDKGAEGSKRVIDAMARGPVKSEGRVVHALLVALVIATAAVGYWAMISAFADVVNSAPSQQPDSYEDFLH